MDQKKIIQLAMGFWPVEGQKCLNTLRGDSKPSCYFKWQSGYLRLHDYGNETFHKMNCFDLAGYKHLGRPISTEEDFKITLRWIKQNVGHIGKLEQKFPERFKFDLQVEMGGLSSKALRWWGQYGINMSQLIEDGVTGVKHYKFNTEKEPRFYKKVIPEEECYCYWYASGHKKIYRPLQTEPWKKWKTDCIETDVHFDNGKKADAIYILGSYKDARVCRNAGFEAKGLQSESAWPGDGVVRKWAAQCKALYFMFDLDRAGYDNSKSMAQKAKSMGLNAAAIYLPPRIKSEHGKKDLAAARVKFNNSLIHKAVKLARKNVIL